MAEFQHLCMGCMKPTHENAVICPFCGYNSQSVQHAPYLPKETVLAGRYLVGKVTEFETDSVTYIGYDLQRRKPVRIHEFLPENIITRADGSAIVDARLGYEQMYSSCLQAFDKLWRGISRLSQNAAVETVLQVFNENSTAYAVTDCVDSITLDEFFLKNNEVLTWSKAYSAFTPVLSALAELHSLGITHGAISPSAITVGTDGRLRLGRFSIAQTKSSIPELRRRPDDGFAPIELYDRSLPVSFTTDIYSIAAVIYKSITGITPPKASDRVLSDTMMLPREVAQSLPEHSIEALVSSMRIYPGERTQSVVTLRSLLSDKIKAPEIAKATNTAAKADSGGQTVTKTDDTKEDASFSSASLAVKTFICAIAVCAIIFCTLYTTFLYKSIDIPILNSVFSSFSFLPMNTDDRSTSEPVTTTEAPTTEPESVRVPDFTALSYEEVTRDAVYNLNFSIEYQFEYSDTIEKGAIIRQSVASGETVAKGTAIVLVVSQGKAKVVLKDVIGQNYIIAYSILTRDGFVVSRETTANDGSQQSGTVCSMSLVAGLEFEKGTQIVLTVWE